MSELILGLGATEHCTSDLLSAQRESVHETSLKVMEVFVSHQFPFKLGTTERPHVFIWKGQCVRVKSL